MVNLPCNLCTFWCACCMADFLYIKQKGIEVAYMGFIDLIIRYFPSFMDALVMTLKLAVCSLLFATVLGVIFSLFTVSNIKPLQAISAIYIDIIRGTPLLVQTFIIYYGLAGVLRPTGFAWANIGGPFTAGVVALSLNAGAYMAEIIRGGIEAVDKGQVEAARSLGLSYGKAMRKIILPQAFLTMLPSVINQFIITLKDTSLISIIGIRELTQNGKIIAANTSALVMGVWVMVAVYYLIICTILAKIAKVVERKISYGRR